MDKSTLSTMTHIERYMHKVIALIMKKKGIKSIEFSESEINSGILDDFVKERTLNHSKPDIIKFYFKEASNE